MSVAFARLPREFLPLCKRHARHGVRLPPYAAPVLASRLVEAARAGFTDWSVIEEALNQEWPTAALVNIGKEVSARVRRTMRRLPSTAVSQLKPISHEFSKARVRASFRDVIAAGYGCGYLSEKRLSKALRDTERHPNSPLLSSAYNLCHQKRSEHWRSTVSECIRRASGLRCSPRRLLPDVGVWVPNEYFVRDDDSEVKEQIISGFDYGMMAAFNPSLSAFDMPSLLRLERALLEVPLTGIHLSTPLQTASSPFGYLGMYEDDVASYLGEIDFDQPDDAFELPRDFIEHMDGEYGMELAIDGDSKRRMVRLCRLLHAREVSKPATDKKLHPAIARMIDALKALRELRETLGAGVTVGDASEDGGPASLALAGDLSGMESPLLDDVNDSIMNSGAEWCSFYGGANAACALDLALAEGWIITAIAALFEGLRA